MVFGYLASFLMGTVLGLLGGGGSILTVPILIVFFQLKALEATTYSLFIVGISAFFGVYQYSKNEGVSWKNALYFALPSFGGVFLSRSFLIPILPPDSKDFWILTTFAVVMLVASFSMIKGRKEDTSTPKASPQGIFISILGFLTGIITGFVGAGGGFLIVPALVFFAKLPIKKAIGTSLVIISANSLFGFANDLFLERTVDWWFLLRFTAIAVSGVFLGTFFSKKVSSQKLKPAFGWFVLIMGSWILFKQVGNF